MRILLLTRSLPYPPLSGDQQRTMFLHRALASFADVDVMLMRDVEDEAFLDEIKTHCRIVRTVEPLPRGRRGPWRAVRPLAPQLIDTLATAAGQRVVDYRPDPRVAPALRQTLAEQNYDLVVGRYIRPTALAGALTCSPLMIDVDDLDCVRYQTWLQRPGLSWASRMVIRWHLRQVQRLLPTMTRQADHLWLASHADIPLIDHASVSVLPNLPYPAALGRETALPPASPQARVILFVGTAGHRVNVEAVRRYVATCWPAIRQRQPDARFHVVGGGAWAEKLPELAAAPGVELRGFATDLAAEYRRAAFVVVPIFEGAGSKIKVLEALAYRRAVVAATPALRGFERLVGNGRAVRSASNETQLCQQCVSLLRNPAERDRLAAAGHQAVKQHILFEQFRRRVEDDVRAVIEGQAASARKPSAPTRGQVCGSEKQRARAQQE